METILKFNTDDEDDFDRLYCAQNGQDFRYALSQLEMYLRGHMKHGHTFKTPDEVLDHYWNLYIDLTEGLRIE
jgi:hypothetical protein